MTYDLFKVESEAKYDRKIKTMMQNPKDIFRKRNI